MRTAAIIMIGDEVVSGLVEEDATHFLGVALRQVLPCPPALLPYCPMPYSPTALSLTKTYALCTG